MSDHTHPRSGSQRPQLRTRRAFLQSAAIASTGAVLPAFLGRTGQVALAQEPGTASPAPQRSRDPIPGFRDDKVLVVIQLSGGNDGLNTLPPLDNDAYRSAREGIAIRNPVHLAEGLDFGLHPALEPLKGLYEDGRAAILPGVGYPNPNRSHFRSMDIWHTASDSDEVKFDGWIGRYFDNHCSGEGAPNAGVNLGTESPLAFSGARSRGVSFQTPSQFRWAPGFGDDSEPAFRQLNQTARYAARRQRPDDANVDFLRHVAANVTLASDGVRDALGASRRNVDYPQNPLAGNLRHIAGLINGELSTRIYYTSLGGFDTHARQAGNHQRLLGWFAESVAAFLQDLRANGQADRVVVMAFSEFGRRVAQNGSQGTDHGTAGPMFLFGDPVRPGVHTPYPSISELDRGGDLLHTADFRSVYAGVLDSWFGIDPSAVLGRTFEPVAVIA